MQKLKNLSLLLLLMLGSIQMVAQCTESITLSSQAEVDAFPLNYGCTEIDSYLVIEGNDITNLDGLSGITIPVHGLHLRNNPSLSNIEGLSNIVQASRLQVENNPLLTNLDALSQLDSITYEIIIENNAQLENIDGLSQITHISNLNIIDNPLLLNIDGLNNLEQAYEITIENNTALQEIPELSNLTLHQLNIINNPLLTNIQGFNNSATINYIYIENNENLLAIDGFNSLLETIALKITGNNALENINGFSSLTEIIDGYFPSNKGLWFEDNQSLTSIPLLENLLTIRRLTIINNNALTTIEGLANVETIYSLVIKDNEMLSECCAISCLSNTWQSNLIIENNNTNCNSIEEIQSVCPLDEDCTILCANNITLSTQEEVDNFYGCSVISGSLTIEGNDINNLNGLQNIENIGGSLVIENTSLLTNLNGLENLLEVRNLFIRDNSALENLEGLNNLSFIHIDVLIENNDVLENIDAISDIGGGDGWFSLVKILNNPTLTHLPSLSDFDFYKTTVENNDALLELGLLPSGFVNFKLSDNASITNIHIENPFINGGSFSIKNNESLETIEITSLIFGDTGFSIKDNPNLTTLICTGGSNECYANISGNDNLVDLTFDIGGAIDALTISNNNSLTNLNQVKFEHIDDLNITSNASLISLDNLEVIQEIDGLEITNNPLLYDCCAIPFTTINNINYLTLSNNATGCNSMQEIIDSCDNVSRCDFDYDITLFSQAEIDAFECENVLGNLIISGEDITNLDGLSGITTIEGDLSITNNPNLSNCCSVPCWIDAAQGQVIIENNAEGCNSLSDIEESCEGESCVLVTDVNLNVFLEGAYNPSNEMMKTTLQDLNLLPLFQPYNVAPYNYQGLESVATASDLPNNIVDWVLIEARGGTPNLIETSTTITETNAGFLLSDGSIVGTNGNPMVFRNLEFGIPYHFVVRHRNHLDIISKEAIVADDQMTYDFTTNIDQAFGSAQQKLLANGKAALFVGDYVQDGVIQITDYDVWKDNPAQNNIYTITDGTLDGVVQNTDADAWRPNKAKIGVVEIRF